MEKHYTKQLGYDIELNLFNQAAPTPSKTQEYIDKFLCYVLSCFLTEPVE